MFFEEQARIFVQLITSHAAFTHHTPLPKKKLARMLIHVRKIFNGEVSFKCHC